MLLPCMAYWWVLFWLTLLFCFIQYRKVKSNWFVPTYIGIVWNLNENDGMMFVTNLALNNSNVLSSSEPSYDSVSINKSIVGLIDLAI